MLDGLRGPMTLPQTVPLMSPGAGCVHSSSLTSLHHPRQCHRQLAVLACNASIPLVPTALADAGRRGAQRSEVKEEAEGRGTRTELSAMSSGVLTCLVPTSEIHLERPQCVFWSQ